MKELRVFYNRNNEIVWTHGLEGSGVFPTAIEADLKEFSEPVKVITLKDPAKIDAFNASDKNKVVSDKVIIGAPTPLKEPEPDRDILAEHDELVSKLKSKGIITD